MEIKEDQGGQTFKVFVYLYRMILDFKNELEGEFISSGGI